MSPISQQVIEGYGQQYPYKWMLVQQHPEELSLKATRSKSRCASPSTPIPS